MHGFNLVDKASVKLAADAASSVSRVVSDKKDVIKAISNKETANRLRNVVKPRSISKIMKKAGVVLVLSPDPITDLPGIVLIGASYLAKRKDPIGLGEVAKEAGKILDEMQSLLFRLSTLAKRE